MPHTYADLRALADAAEIVVDVDQQPEAAAGLGEPAGTPADISAAPEADDDPHRLARVNLARYNSRTDGRTIAYWREEWYVWKRNCYRKISDKELRAKLSASIKEEFDRLCRERQAIAAESARDGGETPVAQKVTSAVVTNVLQATSGMTCIGGEVEPNTWLPTKERRHYTSMANGLLDINAVLADGDDYLQFNTPQWFSLVSLPYAFDPDATCPTWDAFLMFNLEEDTERIQVLQEWAGYCLLPTTSEQKFMVLEGEGSNGKSVFIAGLTAMLGVDNVSNVALENFADRFQRTDTIGKLLNAAGDCGELDKAAEGILKSFTSGDRMYFDRKGLAGLNCTPTARLMIACNNRPRFSDRSEGIWRRMLVVPWKVAISAEKRVKGMDKTEWWRARGELPGIFRWALRGLARLHAQGGFSDSEEMRKSLAEYKEEMNPARYFLTEHVEENLDGTVRTVHLYKFYKSWTEENGYHYLAERSFGKEVKRVFPNARRVYAGSRTERFWAYRGIQFSQDEILGEKTADLPLF